MKQDRSLVRASDVGLWAYCQRAWWLARIQGVPHRDPSLLQKGNSLHAAHGAKVMRVRTLQRTALALLAAALLLALAAVVLVVLAQ